MMKTILFALAFFVAVAAAQETNVYPVNACANIITTDVPAPRFLNGKLDNNGITLWWRISNLFNSAQFEFVQGKDGSVCGYNSGQSFTSNAFWAFNSSTSCGVEGTIKTNYPGNQVGNVLGNCFLYDNTTDANWVRYQTTVKITTTVLRTQIRDEPITRTVVTFYRLAFRFQRYITITPLYNLNATGYANVSSDIVTQSFDPVSRVYHVRVFTSIQSPYLLVRHPNGLAYDLTDGGYLTSPSGDDNLGTYGAPTEDANARLCDLGTANCVQYFDAYFKAPAGACQWAPKFTFYFQIRCQPDYLAAFGDGACTEIYSNYTKPYFVTMQDFCVQVVDTIGLTGTMKLYRDFPSGANPGVTLNNYLYYETAYFRADITAANGQNVLIDYVEFISATITSFNKVINLTPSIVGNNLYSFAYYNNLYLSQSTSAGAAGFSIVISDQSIGLNDAENDAQTVSATATFRVSYLNANNDAPAPSPPPAPVSVGYNLFATEEVEVSQHIALMEDIGSTTSVLQTDFIVVRPSTAVTSTSSLVPAVAASAAGVALLSMFVAFVLYRRRTSGITKAQRTPPESKDTSASA